MGKYWDIYKILPYQRRFNFINGERSIGKTYTTQKFLIKQALEKDREFSYIVRTQKEKEGGILKRAFGKVTEQEYPAEEFFYNNDEMFVEKNGKKKVIGRCHALTEAVKLKKTPLNNIYYMLFDEYMLELSAQTMYIHGWKEPDLLLSIYHSFDRDEDRIICFLLGNNTTFYNPYHMHPAFNIPIIQKGELWTGKNVLFQWATASEELKEEKKKSLFQQMIEGSDYGAYAVNGQYSDSEIDFIEQRPAGANHLFSIRYNGMIFGVWLSRLTGTMYIDSKYDPSNGLIFALNYKDQNEKSIMDKGSNFYLKYLANNFKKGKLKFVSPEVKALSEGAIKIIL